MVNALRIKHGHVYHHPTITREQKGTGTNTVVDMALMSIQELVGVSLSLVSTKGSSAKFRLKSFSDWLIMGTAGF